MTKKQRAKARVPSKKELLAQVKELSKFPKCKHCYDKGYSTEFQGGQFCMADFIGDKTYQTKGAGIVVRLCNCGRGKDLALFFNIKKQYKR
jgi:hypothetical protein